MFAKYTVTVFTIGMTKLGRCCTVSRDYEEVREVIPRIGPIPNVIPLKLVLDILRDPVFPRGLTDSQSCVPIFSTVDS